MSRSLRDARLCLAGAALCTASGVYFAVHTSWLCVLGFYTATFPAWCASRSLADHRQQAHQQEQARRDDYQLDDTSRAAFEGITRHYDDRSAA